MTVTFTPQPLLAARDKRGWSQEQLATAAGVSRGTVQNLECGRRRPHLDHLIAIAGALDVPMESLFTSHDPESSTDSTGCGPTRDTAQPASTSVSPIQTGV